VNAADTVPRHTVGRKSLSPVDRRNRWGGIAAALCMILYAFFLDPEKIALFKCVFKEWTGRDCFACGLSHSLHAAAEFDWMAALQYHIFGPVLFLSAWILSAYWTMELALGVKGFIKISHNSVKAVIAAAACIWLFCWLYNIGIGPT